MAAIKSLSAIREKWTRVTPGRVTDYSLGIKNPKRDWETETIAAEDRYKAGVDAAAAKGMFGKGVKAAGSKKWEEMALKKGPGRFSEGVYIAGPAFEKAFAPFHAVIERTTLPPRFTRGDPRNYDIVRAIGTALHEEKVG
ncbi:hypothetical protein ES703_113008 [subsurface metagenome]